MTATVDAAYATCASITREQARNFHYGIRLVPPSKRGALSAVYALARRIDDIGDSDLPAPVKLEGLARVRSAIADPSVDPADDVLVAVRDAAAHFAIPVAAFAELVDGVEMDVVGRRYDTFDELVDYCRCVAGSIGRLCLGIFGAADLTTASGHADNLGVALQQTNILRDIREDLLAGRVYLPQDDLDRFGVELRIDDSGRLVDDAGALSALIRWTGDRARAWYDDGLRLVPMLDRRSAACCIAMAGIYRRLLDTITSDPALVMDRRVSLTGWQKSVLAARALAGATP